MVLINWTIQAKEDLYDIAEYISKDSKKYAKYQIKKIRVKTNLLKTDILVGKKVEEYNDENLREIFEGNYRIIYKIKDFKKIDIITIHHGARDLIKRKL